MDFVVEVPTAHSEWSVEVPVNDDRAEKRPLSRISPYTRARPATWVAVTFSLWRFVGVLRHSLILAAGQTAGVVECGRVAGFCGA
jgi:hypothetical protein